MKFKKYSFLSLLSNIADNRGKTCPTEDSGIPLIATNCIKNDSLYPAFEKVRYVSEKTYKNWFRCHPKPNDMIFVCKGSPGRVAWTPEPINFCIAQDMVAIRANEKIVHPKYLFALLRSDETQKQIENMHVGTLIPHFKKGDFGNLYFDIPDDFNHQKLVGDTYFDLCLKIEKNRQINQTLEQIAQAIFKSWFVDFDPVYAKMEGRQPVGMDAETAALFPEELEESELGKIPKGWIISKIEDIAEKVAMGPFGSNIKVETFVDDGVPVISGQHLRDTLLTDTSFNYVTEPHAEKLKSSAVFSGDIIFTHAGNIGQVSLIPEKSKYEKYIISQRQFYLRPNLDKTKSSYLVYFFRSPLGQHLLLANATQVGVPSISRPSSYLKGLEIVCPPIALLEKFDVLINSFFSQMMIIRAQTNNLILIRDALLPKLLSGGIEVGEVA